MIYMFLSNNPSSGDINSSNLSCFSYFSTKTYVLGSQKNRLNETVLFEHPNHMFKLMDKKINGNFKLIIFA